MNTVHLLITARSTELLPEFWYVEDLNSQNGVQVKKVEDGICYKVLNRPLQSYAGRHHLYCEYKASADLKYNFRSSKRGDKSRIRFDKMPDWTCI